MRTHLSFGALKALMLLAVCGSAGLVTSASAGSEDAANRLASPDLFGELVDVVTPGYLHWSKASGDTVDPQGDRDDLDNSFGDHAGAVDAATFSSQARAYARGSVAEEAVYAYAGNTVRWEFRVPGPGQYVLATRFWRELQERTSAVVSYRSGERWVDLPAVADVEHWGDYSRLTSFLIEVPAGQKTVPVRIRAASGRCLFRRALLGKKRGATPFLSDAKPTHPSLHFHAADLPTLREGAKSGPAKLAADYMAQQVGWYANTLSRGDREWQPQYSEHHVDRSVAQTAFLHVLTGKPEYLDTVGRMIDTVVDWPRNADPIADQRAGFNILARARQLSALAMGYDWLHGRLPARKTRRLASLLDEEANRLFLYNETIVGGVESGSWDPWIAAGYGMAGLALRKEHPWAQNWIDSARRIFRLNLHQSREDFGYFDNGFVKALDFAVSLRTAAGEDLFASEGRSLKAVLDTRLMLLDPLGQHYAAFGDAQGSNNPLLALCCAKFLRDPLAQWFVRHLSCRDAEQVKTWGWQHIMPVAVATLYDPTLREEAPGGPRLALARSFTHDPDLPPGLRDATVLRTGFGQPTDIQLAFRCGDFAGWHGHPDQGSFILNALGDSPVIDRALGAPYGTPASDFSRSALAHSTVLVDGQGQVPYSSPVFYDSEAGHTGPLLHTRFIDYVLADSTVAYRKNPQVRAMERTHRHFLFIRKPDRRAYVVLFDDLKKDGQPHSFDWLLQTDPQHSVEAAGEGRHVIRGKADLHVFTLEPKRVERTTSDHFGLWRTLKLRNPDATPRGLFLSVLYPVAGGAPVPGVERLGGEGVLGVRVGSADAEDLFLFATGAKPVAASHMDTDARIVAIGREGGKVAWFLATAGTRLEVDGQGLFESDRPVAAAFDATRTGCIVSDGPAAVTLRFGQDGPATLKIEAGMTLIERGRK